MFIIRKHYKGREYARIENPDVRELGELLASELAGLLDRRPDLSLSIEVDPRLPRAAPILLPATLS